MSLSFPDTPKKITPAKQVTITIAQTQAAGFVTRARGVRSMSGVRSSFVVTETFGVSTCIVTSRNARQGARFRCVVLDDKRSTVFAFRVFGYKKKLSVRKG